MNIGLIKPFIHNSNSKQKESVSIDNITYNSFSPKQMIIWLHLISETLQDIWADFSLQKWRPAWTMSLTWCDGVCPSHAALGTDHNELGVPLPCYFGDWGDDFVGGARQSAGAAFGCCYDDGFGAPWGGSSAGSSLGHW